MGWYRHMALAMWALALLTVLRARAIAIETFEKSLPYPKIRAVQRCSRPPVGSHPAERPEIWRVLWRLVLALQQTTHHVVAWSHSRLGHQAIARGYHYDPRGGVVGTVPA
jgi:hypothetical protein